jgi:ligand-binding sensor domain-containing protein/DNA-binding CsgD family transcriptional regulator
LIIRCRTFLAVLFILFLATTAEARTFLPVGATKGLEARAVPALMFDSQGFLWLGSLEGLYCYDGYRAQAFLPKPGDPDSISDIDVRALYESADGSVWAGTHTAGLDRFDPASGRFQNFAHDPDDPASLINNSINAIVEGPAGFLWVGTERGLSRLDRESGQFRHFVHEPGSPGSLSGNEVSALHYGASGALWISTTDGIHRWNPQNQDFTRFDLASLTGGPANRNHVLAIHEDKKGQLWAGTRDGLVRLDVETGRAQVIDLGNPGGFPPVITALNTVADGTLWLTTMARGLIVLDPDTGEWNESRMDSEQALIGLAIGHDQAFIGTWGRGVYRTPLQPSGFQLFSTNDTQGLTNNVISSVLVNREDGQLWIGNYGGGPQQIDRSKRQVLTKPLRRHQMREASVLSLVGPIDGRLYAGTTHGLYEFTGDGTQAALYAYDPANPGGIGKGGVTALLTSGISGLWAGMEGSGLYFFDTGNQLFRGFRHDPARTDSISENFVTALLKGEDGSIWVGTRSSGLNRCLTDRMACERFSGQESDGTGLSNRHVTVLFRDRRGRIWVGTDGGLNRVQQDADGNVTGFKTWNTDNGLLNNAIMAIEEDLDESLWLSSRYGLTRLNPATGNIVNYISASGLPVSHFNAGASASDERFIYFGSTGGLLAVPKGTLLAARKPPAVRVTAIERAAAHGASKRLDAPGGLIRLPFGGVLSIELTILDFAESLNEYAFRLDPEDPWTTVGSQRQLIFSGLAPGQYEFQARGRDAYGIWGESKPLLLEIVPPFWMTTWFRLLLAAVFLLLILAIHLARQATLKRRADELLRLGEKREQALEERLGSEAELAVLTPRQKEILQLIAEGRSTREIAELFGISVKTVEAHRANLMERLDVYDVPGLVRLAIRSRLVALEN